MKGRILTPWNFDVGWVGENIFRKVLENDQAFAKYFAKVNGIESVRGNIASTKGLVRKTDHRASV
jgi:hypothetical protein